MKCWNSLGYSEMDFEDADQNLPKSDGWSLTLDEVRGSGGPARHLNIMASAYCCGSPTSRSAWGSRLHI